MESNFHYFYVRECLQKGSRQCLIISQRVSLKFIAISEPAGLFFARLTKKIIK